MKKYKKMYFDAMGISEGDFVQCESCGSEAVEIHHVEFGAKKHDAVDNLIAVCRRCHNRAHGVEMKRIRERFHAIIAGRERTHS